MTIELEGDIRQLEQWRKQFEDADKALDITSRAMAEELLQLTFERFRSETDPYGKRWKPKKEPDGRKVLSGPTSRLKNGWHIVRADHNGWVIAPSVDYALPHQTGSLSRPQRLVRRAMVPYKGLPRSYRVALEETAQESLFLIFSGGGSGGGGGDPSLVARKFAGLKRRISVREVVRRVVRRTVSASG